MPIIIDQNINVYTKEEIDNLLDIKADKVDGAINEHIAGLTGLEGNLLDTGYSIDDLLIGKFIDFGSF